MQAPAQLLHVQLVVLRVIVSTGDLLSVCEELLIILQQPGLFGNFHSTLCPTTQLNATQFLVLEVSFGNERWLSLDSNFLIVWRLH